MLIMASPIAPSLMLILIAASIDFLFFDAFRAFLIFAFLR